MSTLSPTPFAAPGKSSTLRARLPAWAREPLLHFVVLGLLLFGVDHVIASRADDPRTLVVDAAVDGEARKVFREARGREPNADELYALRRVWLDNEVLYREGLALAVDKGDPMIRERVIFKALSIVSADLQLPPIDDAGLRAWFEKNRARYDEPARYDFQEAVLAGDRTEGAVRSLVQTLRTGTPGEVGAGLRIFKGRPRANLVQGYGEAFAHALEDSAPGQWRALESSDGWRAVQLLSTAAAKPADYAALRGVVLHDWTDATMAEQRSAAVHALARKYTVKVESPK
jgi:hypothetical protein